ncbi:magnesium and cobalt transport protein CorA [Aquimonas sp.]|jgi:magnesium transporter|uniref:magnesium and cobalt transport protein CorA n=1 Tax=Aquimonas sp. TaxID=1872588 RepID=UPI0037BEC5A5
MIVNCIHYHADGRREALDFEHVSDVLASGEGFIWVGLTAPDPDLMLKLQEEFSLHELAIEDSHKAHQRPKVELYDNVLFIAVHTVQMLDEQVRFGETHLFLGERFLLTVRHGSSVSYAPARARCERDPEYLAAGPSFGLYAVLDQIVDNYFPIVDGFREALDVLERDIFDQAFRRGTIERLYQLKRELTRLRLAVAPLQDVLAPLERLYPNLIHPDTRLYFRDVLDHAVRINESTDTLREMLTAAMSVNLALVTVAQGEVVKRLAGWAALLAVPTLVTGWYGMNFELMPELSTRFGYPGVLVLTLGIVLLLYRKLKKVQWL